MTKIKQYISYYCDLQVEVSWFTTSALESVILPDDVLEHFDYESILQLPEEDHFFKTKVKLDMKKLSLIVDPTNLDYVLSKVKGWDLDGPASKYWFQSA